MLIIMRCISALENSSRFMIHDACCSWLVLTKQSQSGICSSKTNYWFGILAHVVTVVGTYLVSNCVGCPRDVVMSPLYPCNIKYWSLTNFVFVYLSQLESTWLNLTQTKSAWLDSSRVMTQNGFLWFDSSQGFDSRRKCLTWLESSQS